MVPDNFLRDEFSRCIRLITALLVILSEDRVVFAGAIRIFHLSIVGSAHTDSNQPRSSQPLVDAPLCPVFFTYRVIGDGYPPTSSTSLGTSIVNCDGSLTGVRTASAKRQHFVWKSLSQIEPNFRMPNRSLFCAQASPSLKCFCGFPYRGSVLRVIGPAYAALWTFACAT